MLCMFALCMASQSTDCQPLPVFAACIRRLWSHSILFAKLAWCHRDKLLNHQLLQPAMGAIWPLWPIVGCCIQPAVSPHPP